MKARGLLRQLASFGGVGLVATLVHIAVALVLSQKFGWGAVASNGLGAAIAFCVSYFGNEQLTFEAGRKRTASLWRYATLTFLGFVITSVIMAGVQRAGAPPYLYVILVLATVPPLTFVLSKLWVFKERSSA